MGQLEFALLADLKGAAIEYDKAARGPEHQADIEITILNVLHHFSRLEILKSTEISGPESPLLKPVRDFTAFCVAYLPRELANVLNVLPLGSAYLNEYQLIAYEVL